MFTVKMISNVSVEGEEEISSGEIIYEETFDNLNQIDINDFMGTDFTVEVINNENGSKLTINK